MYPTQHGGHDTVMQVNIKNHDPPDLVPKVCFKNAVNGVEEMARAGSRLTVGSGHGYIVDETESARGIFTTVVARGAHNTESPSRCGWG